MRHLKPASLPLLFVAAILVLPANDATAHDRGHRHYSSPVVHFAYRQAQLPRWLRRDYRFISWYRVNYIRFGPHVHWKSLRRHYQRDYRYHRQYRKRYALNRGKRLKKQQRDRRAVRRHRRG